MAKETRSSETLAGLKRRDVFKLGAAAAAGAGVIVLERAVAPRTARAQGPAEFLLAEDGFSVDIAGLPALSAHVRRVEIDPLEIKSSRTRPRRPLFPEAQLIVMAEPVAELELRSWVEPAVSGSCERKTITINLHDATGLPARTFNLMECSPVRWSFGGYDSLHETLTYSLTVQVHGIEMS